VDKRARDVVEGGNRPATIERRGVGDRFRRQRARTEIVGEGNAEAGAVGPFDQPQLRPAASAERTVRHQRRIAGETLRREGEVGGMAGERRGAGPEAGKGAWTLEYRVAVSLHCRETSAPPNATPCGAF